MSKLKRWMMVGLALLLNNVVLLWFVGYFSDQDIFHKSQSAGTPKLSDVADIGKEKVMDGLPGNPPVASQSDRASIEFSQDIERPNSASLPENERLLSAFRALADTDGFVEILDRHQINAGQRYTELQNKYGSFDADELYDEILNTQSYRDRQFAMQMLAQGLLGQLEVFQLKHILEMTDIDQYTQSTIISNLLERGDSDALVEAKAYLSKGETAWHVGQDLVRNIYDVDPDFIADYIDGLDLSSARNSYAVLSVALEDPAIAKRFFKRNIDEFIDSTNTQIYSYISFDSVEELTENQQNKVAKLIASPVRKKRQFAIGLVNHIDDIDALRDAFAKLEKSKDKRSMIYRLARSKDNIGHTQLAKELADAADDPELIKQLN